MFSNDSFVEYSFKGKLDKYFYLKLLLAVFVFILGNMVGVFLNGQIGVLILSVGFILFFYFLGYRKIEYEYTLTNGSVEIAAIYKASKRKELLHFDMEQVVMIVPKGSKRIENEKVEAKRKFVSQKEDGQQIALIVEIKNKRQLVILEPDERCLKHIKLYAKNICYDL